MGISPTLQFFTIVFVLFGLVYPAHIQDKPSINQQINKHENDQYSGEATGITVRDLNEKEVDEENESDAELDWKEEAEDSAEEEYDTEEKKEEEDEGELGTDIKSDDDIEELQEEEEEEEEEGEEEEEEEEKENEEEEEGEEEEEEEGEEEEGEEGEEEEDDKEGKNAEEPHLTCAVFSDNAACNLMCSIMGTIFAEPVITGTCIAKKGCICDTPTIFLLEEYWNLKFDSRSTLKEIRKNNTLSKKILEVLKIPYQTPQQTKQDLASLSLLTPEQLKNLRVKDEETKELFTGDGAPNPVAIQKYVSEKLKSSPLELKDYKKPLLKSLNSVDKNTFDRILHAIRQSKNEPLNTFLDSYVKDNKIIEHPIKSDDDQECLVRIIDTAIINETVHPQENPYILEGFDTTEVARYKEESKDRWDKCWSKPNVYKVCIIRNRFCEAVDWNNMKQHVEVEIRKFFSGTISQKWVFTDGSVELRRDTIDGKVDQFWYLPDDPFGKYHETATFRYFKSRTGKVVQKWVGNKEHWESVQQYKSFMDAWCAENNFYVAKQDCIIY